MGATVPLLSEHVPISAAEYHASDAIGASMLETFRHSRRLFQALYVTRTIEPSPPTPAMELGTLVHLRILEPERFAECVAEPYPETAPDGKEWLRRKGSDHERWWAEEVEARAGKIAATENTLATVEAIAESVGRNWHARRLIDRHGTPEFSIFWTDKETGLRLKCRVDWMAEIPLDLKTTTDPAPGPYARQIVKLGYHRKAAHYLAGLQQFTGEPTPMVHLAVGTSAPYPVAVYEIDDRDANRSSRSLGAEQWRETLRQVAECMSSGDWSEPYEREIVALRLPGWAFSEDAYSFF